MAGRSSCRLLRGSGYARTAKGKLQQERNIWCDFSWLEPFGSLDLDLVPRRIASRQVSHEGLSVTWLLVDGEVPIAVRRGW